MPEIKKLLKGWNETNGKDKLSDFAEEYWHYDNITRQSAEAFVDSYLEWAESKGYHRRQDKAIKIYALAKEGIPTVSSSTPSTKMLVQGKRLNIGCIVNQIQFLHNGNQVVFHYTFILEDDHGQILSPPFSARMAPAYY